MNIRRCVDCKFHQAIPDGSRCRDCLNAYLRETRTAFEPVWVRAAREHRLPAKDFSWDHAA